LPATKEQEVVADKGIYVMRRLKNHLRNSWRVLLAVLVFAGATAAVDAAGIGFRNDTNQVLYVQGAWVTKAGVQRGSVLVIKPGQTVWDNNLKNGTRTITVCDGTNRTLLLDSVNFDGTTDQLFGVAPIQMPMKNGPRVKLNSLPLPPAGGN
jgi:hypothetical protein